MFKLYSATLLLALLLTVRPGLAPAAPLGRSFTYQGQLQHAGVPVEGAVSLRFSLWDAPSAGAQLGVAQALPNVPVSGGVFSVALNGSAQFGAQAFNGEARWLQVEVCTDSTCSSTTVLGPRQPITGAPYALGPWQLTGTSLSYSQGNVGIGTSAPALPLHVKGNTEAVRLQGTAAGVANDTYVGFADAAGRLTGYVGDASASDDDTYIGSQANNVNVYAGGFVMSAQSNGRVGIGTYSPADRLEVRGNIRLGALGELFATGSTENLRIVRGEVLSAGTISSGTGFTVTHPATGSYNIIFTTPFQGASHPTLVVTPLASAGIYIAMGSALPSPSVVSLRIVNGSGSAIDGAFSFMVIGAR